MPRTDADGLLLLHGFAGSARTWGPIHAGLAVDRSVVAPDWPGYGTRRDEVPLASCEAMADFALAQATEAGLLRFDVLGHSMSGFVVQQLLLQAPDRVNRAVLYGAGLQVDPSRRFEPLAATIRRLELDGVEQTVRRVAATWFVQGAAAAAYPACVDAGLAMSLPAAIASMQAFEYTSFAGRLVRVTNQALVIAGDRERTFPPEMACELWRALPNARLSILPNAGHAAHLEQPERFTRDVRDFLAER